MRQLTNFTREVYLSLSVTHSLTHSLSLSLSLPPCMVQGRHTLVFTEDLDTEVQHVQVRPRCHIRWSQDESQVPNTHEGR